MKSKLEMNTAMLNRLSKNMKALKGAEVQIGIFGNKNERPGGNFATNAEIGQLHEFGSLTKKIPQRSFLRMPVKGYIKEITKISLEALSKLAAPKKILKDAGIMAEKRIDAAFQTAGFGEWKENTLDTILGKVKGRGQYQKMQKAAESFYEGKTHTMPLIDTGALRRSIASRVIMRGKDAT